MAIYQTPQTLLAGATVKVKHWNIMVNDLINLEARIAALEALGGTPPEPTDTTPIGAILGWAKPAADIPTGWQICNGTNGTFDLRGAFIYGAANDGEVGTSGGANTHIHTNPGTSVAGSHSHTASGNTSTPVNTTNVASGSTLLTPASNHYHSVSFETNSGGDHSHSIGNTGSGSSLPPYVKVYLIQKIA